MPRRSHLFEFGDQPWFPQVLRDAETAYLSASYRISPLPRLWAKKIATLLPPDGRAEILDLCSGSGGPMPQILKELDMLGLHVSATLTDRYPNLKVAPHPHMSWATEPVDATTVPRMLPGVRTMFSAFHHFRPDEAKAILRNAFEGGRTICIFEAGSATLLCLATMALVPFSVLALMPFVRPFRWSYLLLTYFLPVLPLTIFWDGVVSMLRVYSPDQMAAMTANLQRSGYCWDTGSIAVRGMPGGMPYLIGRLIK